MYLKFFLDLCVVCCMKVVLFFVFLIFLIFVVNSFGGVDI